MSEPTKKAAIIGLGGQGRAHYAAYKVITDVKVVAVCESNTERLSTFIDENPNVRVYPSANALFKEERCDILSIVTNTPSHADLTTAAVEAGVSAVLCEKPMAHSLSSARQMIDMCADRGVRLAINHMRRWSPRYHQLRDMLKTVKSGENWQPGLRFRRSVICLYRHPYLRPDANADRTRNHLRFGEIRRISPSQSARLTIS